MDAKLLQQKRFELVAQIARDIVLVIASDGRIIDCNRAAELAYQHSRDGLLALNITDLRAPSTVAVVPSQMAVADRQGILFETEHLRADGTSFPCEVSSQGGEVEGERVLFSIIRDISERRRAEAVLHRSEEGFRAMIERSPEGIVVVRDGRTVYANASVLATLRYDNAAEIIGRSPLDLLHPDERAVAAVRLAALTAGETPQTRDFRFIRKDGSPVVLESQGMHVTFQGEPALMFTGREVTARRRAEEEVRHSQKMEAIGRLAGGVAHDFNNILTAILGHAELLLQELPEGGAHKQAEQIERSATRAAQLTGQLLAFSRKQMLQPRVLDLGQLLEGMTGMLQRLIPESIDFVTDLHGGQGLYVRADPSQLEQVLINLAVNARDAMPGGGEIRVRLSAAEVTAPATSAAELPVGPKPGRYALIEVTDTGAGMDENTRTRAFEPFFTTKGKGTGLGLSIVYGIVTQSGGHVTVDSEPGKGARFQVHLPIEAGAIEVVAVPGASGAPRGTETILLVEDDTDVRQFIADLLELQGYTVIAARDGADALRVAADAAVPVDLLVSDVIMPRMSGTEVAEKLRERRPGLRVLFVSGYPGESMIRQGVISESLAFVQKPFSIVEFTRRVREVLDAPETPC